MEQWNTQYRPAPEFEQQQISEVPAETLREPSDLEAMAITLDHMKVEAAIDSERTRPSLNGLFAFLLTTGVVIIGLLIVQYGIQSQHVFTGQKVSLSPQMLLLGGAVGVLAGLAVALLSARATRRTQRAVRAYEQRLLDVGGTPLADRGRPLDTYE